MPRSGSRLAHAARPSPVRLALAFALLPSLGAAGATRADDEFYAHYTRIDSGEAFERLSRTGDAPDLVVRIGGSGGQLVFCRATSFLPYWETDEGTWPLEELTPREGDGTVRRPDRVNTFSHVHLVEQTPERVLVLWRYLPRFGGGNPHTGVSPNAFAEELFEISPGGEVERTLRLGTERYDDWVDPGNRTVQGLQLAPDGVRELRRSPARRAPPPERPAAPPPPAEETPAPVGAWRFDEGGGDATVEDVSGHACAIEGHRSLWREGVSGTALLFDGYTSLVTLPGERSPSPQTGVTLSGWVALGAYPWNWAPIVQKGEEAAWTLGVDGHGHPGVKVEAGGRWESLVAQARLERYRWYHLAGSYDGSSGELSIFIDGRLAGKRVLAAAPLGSTRDAIRIGKGTRPLRPVDPVRENTFETEYGFDGLIDEVRIHARALGETEVARAYERQRPGAPDLEYRLLPEAPSAGRFGARYDHLRFYESWDVLWRFGDYPDVVVSFDRSPARFVFWRGPAYIPMLVNGEGQWYSNEFNETWGRTGGQGCQEPMSDKEAYTNHVRILESTDARVVVHWRYPLKDVLHVYANWNEESGWADWSDWTFTIYPDGVAAKRMRLWTDGPRNHEWHEAMAILGPNQHPETVIETEPALILADLEGNADTYSWKDGPPRGVDYRDKKIHVVNYRSSLDPFTIGDFTGGDVYGGEVTDYAVFPSWNHWPVAQVPSDGRYSRFPDRTAHSSLTHVSLPDHAASLGERPYQEKLLLEGLSDATPAELAVLARSWLRAPELTGLAGGRGGHYQPAERAYVLAAGSAQLTFRIEASRARPILNPCFVVLDWGGDHPATVEVDGEEREAGPDLRQGVVRDPAGLHKLVVWMRLEASETTELRIVGARPTLAGGDLGPLQWERLPALVESGSTAAMAVRALPSRLGATYRFERVGSGAGGGTWSEATEHVEVGLAPETTYRFRVQARDRYFLETEWLEAPPLRTPAAPPPLVWSFDEGTGQEARDASGRHAATIRGQAEWVEGRTGSALRLDGATAVVISGADRIDTQESFTWCAWIRTERDGTLLARAGRDEWEQGGKAFFVRDGRLGFDVGWVGFVGAQRAPVADGRWHHVAVTVRSWGGRSAVSLYVDGEAVGGGELAAGPLDDSGLPLQIGYTNDDFPAEPGLAGEIDDVRHYPYVLGQDALERLAGQ
jgi:hypothetical protein